MLRVLATAPSLLLLACARPAPDANLRPATETVTAAPARATAPTPAMPLFDFADASITDWYIQNDGVMGGKSKGRHDISDGRLVFTGTTVTRGGGFSSVLTEAVPSMEDFAGVELRVRGDGRTYQFALHDGVRDRGREVWRRADFATTDEWRTVRISFDALRATAHGEPVDVPVFAKAAPVRVGFYIADGQDGPFRLGVERVTGY